MFLCGSYARVDGNSSCVETGEIKVSEKKLYTGFVYTCSVLTFRFTRKSKNYNFLAHVDALGEHMFDRLYNTMKDLPLNDVIDFNIYYGPLCKGACQKECRCKSMNIIRDVFVKLGLQNRKINEYNLDVWQTEVSIPGENYNNTGTSNILSSPDRIFAKTPEGAFESMSMVIPRPT